MSMGRFVEAIKNTGVGAVVAGSPVEVAIGTVTEVTPLVVLVDQRLKLTSDFLVLTASLKPLTVTVNGTQYSVRDGLMVGDAVLLLRMQGGRQYVVFDKVVDP